MRRRVRHWLCAARSGLCGLAAGCVGGARAVRASCELRGLRASGVGRRCAGECGERGGVWRFVSASAASCGPCRRPHRGRPSAAAYGGATWARAGHVPLPVPAGCRDPGAHSAWDRHAAGAIRADALARLVLGCIVGAAAAAAGLSGAAAAAAVLRCVWSAPFLLPLCGRAVRAALLLTRAVFLLGVTGVPLLAHRRGAVTRSGGPARRRGRNRPAPRAPGGPSPVLVLDATTWVSRAVGGRRPWRARHGVSLQPEGPATRRATACVRRRRSPRSHRHHRLAHTRRRLQPEGDDEQQYHLFLHNYDDQGPIEREAEEKHRRQLGNDAYEAPDYNKLYPSGTSSSKLQLIKADIDDGIKGIRAELGHGLLPWWGPSMDTAAVLNALVGRRDWLERRIDIVKKAEELDELSGLLFHDPSGAYECDPHIDEHMKALELEIEIKKKELQLHELRSLEVHGEDYDVHDDY
eukprot:SAG11_NODE_2526_length_3254_cov_2.986371_2_plen_465_part_00